MMFYLRKDDFVFLGRNLRRPECVLATKSGDVYASHAADRGGIAHIDVNGRTNFIMATAGDIPDDVNSVPEKRSHLFLNKTSYYSPQAENFKTSQSNFESLVIRVANVQLQFSGSNNYSFPG